MHMSHTVDPVALQCLSRSSSSSSSSLKASSAMSSVDAAAGDDGQADCRAAPVLAPAQDALAALKAQRKELKRQLQQASREVKVQAGAFIQSRQTTKVVVESCLLECEPCKTCFLASDPTGEEAPPNPAASWQADR